jgi:hypothetical protein
MRLTLRTLLAYLDDTLEATEIKQIGQKVAESDAAQELIARIKQVTRRRRLTTPPATGPNSFDPNTVAEYLDNEADGDAVAEVEKMCLESDVHLAEIASCHQILTLVLGEPALVPPTAKERMYGLVQGREAIPFRKATAPTSPHQQGHSHPDTDADEMLLLGMPFHRRSSWLRWALPLSAAVLLVVLGLALYQAIAGFGGGNQVAGNDNKGEAGGQNQGAGTESAGTAKDKPGKAPDTHDGKGKAGAEETAKGGVAKENVGKDGVGKPEDAGKKPETTPVAGGANATPRRPGTPGRVAAPSKERGEVASYVADRGGLPSILVQQEGDTNEGWRRLRPGSRIYSTDRLVSLPGYASELRLDKNVRVVLQGLMREFSRDPAMDFLLESAATLHKSADFDADLALDRGRVYITNIKEEGPAKVRLRFGTDSAEVWDVTLLEPGAEVGVDVQKAYTRDINYLDGEDPAIEVYVMFLRGRAQLKIDYEQQMVDRPSLVLWDNKSGRHRGPAQVDPNLPIWKRPPPEKSENPAADDMVIAVKELAKRMVDRNMADKTPPGLAVEEMLHGDATQPAGRRLAIYCMCGLDEVRRLLDTLADEDPTHNVERDAAIFTLRRWISRDAGQSKKLYDPKTKTGRLLEGQKYRTKEAEVISMLLHDFTDVAQQNPETYQLLANELVSDKVAIAELAYWHLRHMAFGAKLPPFNAAAPQEDRKAARAEVLKLIDDGKLPPRPQGPAPDAGGSKTPAPGGGSNKPKPAGGGKPSRP